MSATETSTKASQGPLRFARRMLLGVSFALLTQFMLGMVVNLFIVISKTHPGAGVANYLVGASESVGWAVTREWPFLAPHALLGLSLVALSLTFLVRGLRAPRRPVLVVWNAVGALGGLFAALNGMYFLIDPKADTASMLMATGAPFATLILVRVSAAEAPNFGRRRMARRRWITDG
jgi:hypothetical protein